MTRLTATWRTWLGGLVLVMLLGTTAQASIPETLGFSVVYRGVFSLGQDMPIADLTLSSDRAGGAMTHTRLQASSAAYGFVESVYPIRYRFRTWADPVNGHLVAFEAYEKTKRKKHRLFLRDDSAFGMRRIDLLSGSDDGVIGRLDAGVNPAASSGAPLFDRLGLLQQLRRQTLVEGAEYHFPVTNGRERMRYRVRVESAPMLNLGGTSIPSWKLRFDAYEADEQGTESAAHRPVYIWLSRDEHRVPLRVDVRHAVGLFRAELRSPDRYVRVRTADR